MFAVQAIFKASIGKILVYESPTFRAGSDQIDKVWMPQLTQDINLQQNRKELKLYNFQMHLIKFIIFKLPQTPIIFQM